VQLCPRDRYEPAVTTFDELKTAAKERGELLHNNQSKTGEHTAT